MCTCVRACVCVCVYALRTVSTNKILRFINIFIIIINSVSRILAASSELWRNICQTAKDHGQLGDTLVLRCETHPDQENRVTTAKVLNLTAGVFG